MKYVHVRGTPEFHVGWSAYHCCDFKTDLARSPLKLVIIYQITRCHISEANNLHSHCHETLSVHGLRE